MLKKTILLIILITAISGCGTKFKLDREELGLKSDWPFNRKDLSNSGSIADGQFNGKLDLVWRVKSNDKPAGPITIYYDLLVYPGTRNRLKFIETETGDKRGYIKGKGSSSTGVLVTDSLAVYSYMAPNGKLRCVNLLKRKKLWDIPVKDAPVGSIIYNNILFIGFNDGNLVAVNQTDGSLIWEKQIDSRISVPLLIVERQICQPADDGTIYVISSDSGKIVREINLDYPANSLPVYDKAGSQLIIAGYNGELTALDWNSEKINWSVNIKQPIWSPMAVTEKQLFVAHNGGTVYAVDKSTGQINWEYQATDVIHGGLLAIDNWLVFGTLKGDLLSLNQADGEVVDKKKLKGPLNVGPISDGRYVFVADNRGQISCFGEDNEQE